MASAEPSRQAWRARWESNLPTHCSIAPPPHPTYDLARVIRDALAEDAGDLGDVTTLATVPESTRATATFLAKADGVLAGLGVADMVFEAVDPGLTVEWSASDGDPVARGQHFGTLTGSARSILVAERIALNFMQRMSGIATATAAMVEAAKGSKARILETRKTVPGLRLLDKWAVLIGGGVNHRVGLYDMLMIKDNHIAAAGGIRAAVQRAQEYLEQRQLSLPVELEVRTTDELQQALECIEQHPQGSSGCCVTRIMLDNMARRDEALPGGVDVTLLKEAVKQIAGRVETEASGNVTLESVAAIASSGVDFVSCGALTHSVTALDISLNIETQ